VKVTDPMTVQEFLAMCAGMNVAIQSLKKEIKATQSGLMKDYYSGMLKDLESGYAKFLKQKGVKFG